MPAAFVDQSKAKRSNSVCRAKEKATSTQGATLNYFPVRTEISLGGYLKKLLTTMLTENYHNYARQKHSPFLLIRLTKT